MTTLTIITKLELLIKSYKIIFSDKFKYNAQDNIYTCPQGHKLFCITKKADAIERKYVNYEACSKCPNKDKCTTAKNGRVITRKANEDFVEIVNFAQPAGVVNKLL